MQWQSIGVVGAGVMGRGVAQSLLQGGHRVVLADLSEEILDRAEREIRRNLRFQTLLVKESAREQGSDLLDRLARTTRLEGLASCEFVIENVVENEAEKETLYRSLDLIAPQHAIFAANTSAIPIARIASWTARPDRVLGIHFMNPVPFKPTVEVIDAQHTSTETLSAAKELLGTMSKECLVVADWPGFVSNRVLMLTINEAIELVHDRVASPEVVDRIFTECFSHKMGPLATADLIGLDTILYSLEVLRDHLGAEKYRPSPLLRKMVDTGLHGRKSGQGFFKH